MVTKKHETLMIPRCL